MPSKNTLGNEQRRKLKPSQPLGIRDVEEKPITDSKVVKFLTPTNRKPKMTQIHG